ncbi:ring finger domain-containing [Pyrenophora seminiperda CCB06]|uniref:Ring finger domain-containing n=1 Tax=Pyrenophora seminiperda CCB06 TaxID=1302712 RepID=A0A3M7MAK2_9PLEO|nr:ring finger domain-containing [Pyrenophora seminiperda CCB06]
MDVKVMLSLSCSQGCRVISEAPSLPPATSFAGLSTPATPALRHPHDSDVGAVDTGSHLYHISAPPQPLTFGMEEEGLAFRYNHGQKRSHAQMEEEAGSASPTWRFQTFSADGEAPLHYDARHTGLPLDDDYNTPAPLDDDSRPTRAYLNYDDPPTRYQPLHERRTPDLESALRSRGWEEVAPRHMGSASPAAANSDNHPMLRLAGGMQRMAPARRRWAGDGFDFRRPAGAAEEQEAGSVDLTGDDDDDIMVDLRRDHVIDLTADDSGYGASQDGNNGRQGAAEREQHESSRARRGNGAPRLPRGMDIIIDLDNGEEEWRMATPAPEPSSPDIQFISSRTIHAIEGRHLPPPTVAANHSDGDEVEFLRENPLPPEEVQRRRTQELDSVLDLFGTLNGRFTHLRAQVDRFHAQVNRTAHRLNEPIAPPRSRHAHIRVGAFVAPVMDFDAVAFDLGPRVRESVPPPATYEAPPKAPEGFTRSPEVQGALICPNCEEELCVGNQEIKRQVWISKGCGHVSLVLLHKTLGHQLTSGQVYCGECTANRSAKRSAKGKERPISTEPFKVCVVDGCEKNVSHKKAMIQVFL